MNNCSAPPGWRVQEYTRRGDGECAIAEQTSREQRQGCQPGYAMRLVNEKADSERLPARCQATNARPGECLTIVQNFRPLMGGINFGPWPIN